MKFFVELVACCVCSSNRSRRPAEEEQILVPVATEALYDQNNIITYKTRRRRRRGSARSAGYLPDWKPSLSSISEDADHALQPRMVAANSSRNLKKKVVVAASRPINQLHHHRLDKPRSSRIASLAAMVPAPFLI
ncbi:hypothetical protein HAX54_050206 [Datura stramonium]|uniref:Uncharacterized protein n=1 Tax=Datura stramonium TaxID=4076 RepID=A0ABS8SY28_DATST|nr:hypothetical protein [Datura stramonium]